MRNLLKSYLQRIFGKDLSYIFVFFLASCMWASKPAPKPENALKHQQKRVPIQNAEIVKRMEFEKAQEAGILDLRKNPINGQEISFQRPTSSSSENPISQKPIYENPISERPSSGNSSAGNLANNEQQRQQYFQEEIVNKPDYPTIKQPATSEQATQARIPAQPSGEAKKPEILEISGNQSRQKAKNRNDELIPPPSRDYGKFVISTSPSYMGAKLEEVKQVLSKFGSVKEVRDGDMFSLKVSPAIPLQTEEEARNLVDKIIQASFFDVYIEKL